MLVELESWEHVVTHCPSCAQPVRPGPAFCGECGARLPSPSEASAAPDRLGFISLPPGVTLIAATNTGPAAAPISRSPVSPPATVSVSPASAGAPQQATLAPTIVPPGGSLPPANVAPPALLVAEPADVDSTRMAAPRHAAVWSLMMPNGAAHVVTAMTVIGRAPEPAAHGAVQSISVGAEQKSVSKSHALIELTETGLRVRDLGSVNGVVVVHADGQESDASATVAVDLADGDEIELGEILLVVRKG